MGRKSTPLINTPIKTKHYLIIASFIVAILSKLVIGLPAVNTIPYGDTDIWERILREPTQVELSTNTIGAILPHHLIAAPEMTKVYRALAEQNTPDTIVIIGPNHFETGDNNIQTCDCTYKLYDDSKLKTNKALLKQFNRQDFIHQDNQPFKQEHSIYAHTTFIKEFFPQADILPIMIKWQTPREDLDQLATTLQETLPENTLVIASVDFSHYIPEPIADFHDQESFNSLQNFDYDNILNAEADSPASLYTLSKFAELRQAQKVTLHQHTNSQKFFQKDLEETTSHLFVSYAEGPVTPSAQINLHFFGDTVFNRGANQQILKDFAGQEERFFIGNNSNILNLEGPINANGAPQNKQVVFNYPAATIDILKRHHFGLVNLANNHMYDFFKKGSDNTRQLLSNNRIASFGDYNTNENSCMTAIIDTMNIGFCGFNDVSEVLDINEATTKLDALRDTTDFIIVNMHWGNEYEPTTPRQTQLAHQLIDHGAGLIIGHHPHIIQPMEIYKNSPIFYSLGNFIFDQTEPEETKTGLSVGVTINKDELILYPFPHHTNQGKPTWYTRKERTEFYKNTGFEETIRVKLTEPQ